MSKRIRVHDERGQERTIILVRAHLSSTSKDQSNDSSGEYYLASGEPVILRSDGKFEAIIAGRKQKLTEIMHQHE